MIALAKLTLLLMLEPSSNRNVPRTAMNMFRNVLFFLYTASNLDSCKSECTKSIF